MKGSYYEQGLLTLCLLCFAIITITQIRNYLSDVRSTSTRYRTVPRVLYPVLVFCPKKVSRSGIYDPYRNENEYMNDSVKINVNATSVFRFEGDLDSVPPRVEQEELFTLYNGICKLIKLNQSFGIDDKIRFEIDRRQEVNVFFLSSYKEKLFFSIMALFKEITTMTVTGDMMISVSITITRSLTHDDRPCVRSGVTKFTTCVTKRLGELFVSKGIKCVPSQFKNMMPSYIGKDCTDPEEIFKALRLGKRILNGVRLGNDELNCPLPCVTYSYEIKPSPVTFPNHQGTKKETWVLLLSFLSGVLKYEDEFVIYQFMDMISAIGGALGMFLGWSAYQNLASFILYIRTRFAKPTKFSKEIALKKLRYNTN